MMVAAVALVVAAGGDAALASGGGGCGRPVSDRAGTRVVIRDFCFGPTVLRVKPGQKVSFVNRDSFPHTVLGANASWGSFGKIGGHHRVVYRFTRAGVYPYVCTYHVGMVGTVVVGGGVPRTPHAPTTAKGPVIKVSRARQVGSSLLASTTVPLVAPGVSAVRVVVVGGAIVALLGLGAAAFRLRRRTLAG
jgi:plastocyanin